jgi:hypothetical protein
MTSLAPNGRAGGRASFASAAGNTCANRVASSTLAAQPAQPT